MSDPTQQLNFYEGLSEGERAELEEIEAKYNIGTESDKDRERMHALLSKRNASLEGGSSEK